MKYIYNLGQVLFVLIVGIFLLLGMLSFISNNREILGYRSFLVQSGSMEPAIKTGDIIIIKKHNVYTKSDVVTFYDKQNRVVTHRIIGQEDNHFITKGDANITQDTGIVKNEHIIGKVEFVVPKLGFLVSFGKSKLGLFLLVLLPAGFIIISELFEILKAIKNNHHEA